MNWHALLPSFFLLLIVLLWIVSRQNKQLSGLRRQVPLLFALFCVSFIIFLLTLPPIDTLADFSKPLRIVWLVLFLLALVLAIRLIRYIVFDWLISRKAMERRVKVVEDVAGIVLYVVGILLIADNYLKIQITPLLATSAVITVVAGFALQNILGDLFSGLALNFEEALQIGDWVQIGAIEGRIEQLRWRSMKIRTRDGYLVLIPNQSASKEVVTAFGNSRSKMAVRLTIGIGYENPPDQVMDLIRQKISQLEGVISAAPIEIWISSFEDFAVIYTIRFQIKDPALKEQVAGTLRHHLWYAFKREGITIPFPIRTVIMKSENSAISNQDDILQALQRNELLSQLPPDRLEKLIQLTQVLRFGQGELLIREEEEGRAFFIILSGQVTVSKNGHLLATLVAGDYFGEMALFTGEKTTATVITQSESMVLRITAHEFKSLIAFGEQTAKAISEVIAMRREGLRKQEEAEKDQASRGHGDESANIFVRIKRYFNLNADEPLDQ